MFLRKKNDNNESTFNIESKIKKDNLNIYHFESKLFQNNEIIKNKDWSISKSKNINKNSREKDEKSLLRIGSKCPFDKKCPYYKKYIYFKNELIKLLSSIIKVKDFNHSLLKYLSKRTSLYYNLITENEGLKKILHKIQKKNVFDLNYNKVKIYDNNEYAKKSDRSYNSYSYNKLKKNNNYSMTENNFIKNNLSISKPLIKKNKEMKKLLLNGDLNSKMNIKINNDNNSKNTFYPYNKKQKNLEISTNKNKIRKSLISANLRANILAISSDPKKHYEIIHNYSKQQNQKLIGDSSRFSFLSSNMDYNSIIKENHILVNLEKLTKNDEHFLREISDSSNEVLLKYCDMIIALINDYKEMIKLGLRMKNFLKGSNKFVDSIIDNNPSKVLIENTCSILNCDRASLFILDKASDSLIVYSGEGIKKAQIKVPKDKGIVGACFLEALKIRIDDAYLDKRFNKEVDKKMNYRTKSILCYPLIDKDGECFGVIEAINKFFSPFNEDDEELLKLLSYQASIIFRSISSNDDYKFLALKLNIIVDYNIEITCIKDKFQFTEKTEETLLNLFNCITASFYFVEDNTIKRYKEKEILKYDINIGIIGKSIKLKEILTFHNIKNCELFNSIIDMNTSDGLLTFPIKVKENNSVIGVVQVPYIGKIYRSGKPNDNEIKIINQFSKCIRNWFEIIFNKRNN